MNVDDVVATKIEAARIRAESAKRRRAAFAAARQRGLAARHAQKLRNLRGADDHTAVAQTATTGASRGDTPTASPEKETN